MANLSQFDVDPRVKTRWWRHDALLGSSLQNESVVANTHVLATG